MEILILAILLEIHDKVYADKKKTFPTLGSFVGYAVLWAYTLWFAFNFLHSHWK